MGNFFTAIIFLISALLLFHVSLASVVSTGDFNQDFFVIYAAPGHINTSADGRSTSLTLDTAAASSSMSTKDKYLFGQFVMKMKLVPGYSAGTVTAFYLMSDPAASRDEMDFEFLGNVAGDLYTLQTNVFTNGYGEREQKIKLWFDPTEDFHNYTILWNIYHIVFMVDSVPIRTYRNHADKGVAYPMGQPAPAQISLWDGSSWATDGGRVKIDWSKAPFIASFKDYTIDACVWKGDPSECRADGPSNWWNQDNYSTLTPIQRGLYEWVMKYQITYDYCTDSQRFNGSIPLECSLPKY
ncbi:PREDICTED: probable xyloglucan endotransglucosylase/hydrolase protein 10 [Ipomoea nil]|uniref:probable xyloglucan endotransglucosylase/hydrolase protein 10 n=1 Tax=Ipomoea nil TaxID=35883 RepID=UPI000901726B|nr:PREDICTED: probable xyloglucan endotransglucosylase/hydrolase protein 10 [Ipomoea nil]